MATADWTTISGGGSFVILNDATAPSPNPVMSITGAVEFQNLTATAYKDSRITAWCRQLIQNSDPLVLGLRSLNTVYRSSATLVYTNIYSQGTTIAFELHVVIAGSDTTLVNSSGASQNGNATNTWQQFQFSTFNSGTDILYRIAQWNGSSFASLIDGALPIASYPTLDAAGRGRFGGANNTVYIDDVAFLSLA